MLLVAAILLLVELLELGKHFLMMRIVFINELPAIRVLPQ